MNTLPKNPPIANKSNTDLLQERLIFFPKLSEDKKEFVLAYVACGYSVMETALQTDTDLKSCKTWLREDFVRRAVTEIQDSISNIEFMNEKWVREQLFKLYPKLIGEETVPFVAPDGTQGNGFKFFPEAALKVLEHVAPKKTAPTVSVNINNMSSVSDADLERIIKTRTFDNGVD